MKRKHTVSLVGEHHTITVRTVAADLTIDQACAIAKKLILGNGPVVIKRYGPKSFAYVGRDATAVVSWS